jgi:hypothetical protein
VLPCISITMISFHWHSLIFSANTTIILHPHPCVCPANVLFRESRNSWFESSPSFLPNYCQFSSWDERTMSLKYTWLQLHSNFIHYKWFSEDFFPLQLLSRGLPFSGCRWIKKCRWLFLLVSSSYCYFSRSKRVMPGQLRRSWIRLIWTTEKW